MGKVKTAKNESKLPISPTVLVQVVHSTWSKRARGGAGAQRRGAVPLAFRVQLPPDAGEFYVDLRFFSDGKFFCQPVKR